MGKLFFFVAMLLSGIIIFVFPDEKSSMGLALMIYNGVMFLHFTIKEQPK